MKRKLSIGISDFKEIIENKYYYVDKSLLIKELIDSGSKTILLPRPRRFGKTLNLSMLRYFFEKTDEDLSDLFRGLAIWQQEDTYVAKQGQYPVIYLTFKDVKCLEWDLCYEELKLVIRNEFLRHDYLLGSGKLKAVEEKEFQQILMLTANPAIYANSLKQLSVYLTRYYGQKAVILIDEYDTPIQQGYLHHYYDQVINFMRNFLSGGLKDNVSLEKGVLTGILRVAKESIFSGLNNLEVCSLLNHEFSQYFGLLEPEVASMLDYYGIGCEINEVKKWYNGYLVGDTVIYNPWSILNYSKKWKEGFQPYWLNTSSNDLIKKILTKSSGEVKQDMESLIRGESIRKVIDDNVVFHEIKAYPDALWSFLLLSGYLKIESATLQEGVRYCSLLIPNQEVALLYQQIVQSWVNPRDYTHRMMLDALVTGDIETFAEIFRDYVLATFSTFDTSGKDPEKVYHAFVLGLLIGLQDRYVVKSNRESGYGRYDVMLIPKEKDRLGVVIEFKKARYKETIEEAVATALKQITEKQYETELRALGVEAVLKVGIAFAGKQVEIRAE